MATYQRSTIKKSPAARSTVRETAVDIPNAHRATRAERVRSFSFPPGAHRFADVAVAAERQPQHSSRVAVGPADDVHEREAAHTAETIVRRLETSGGRATRTDAPPDAPTVASAGKVEHRLQRVVLDGASLGTASDAGDPGSGFGSALAAARGGGQPLPRDTRNMMERAFDSDFGHVRIHADQRAAGLAESIDARAFTAGGDIFFGAGAYPPRGRDGHRLVAHELTHVLQQTGHTSRTETEAAESPKPALQHGRARAGIVQRQAKIARGAVGYDLWGKFQALMQARTGGSPQDSYDTANMDKPQFIPILKDIHQLFAGNKGISDAIGHQIQKLGMAGGQHIIFPDSDDISGTLSASIGAAAGRQFAANMAANQNTQGISNKANDILPSLHGHNFELAMAASMGGSFGASGDFDTKSGGVTTTHQAKYTGSNDQVAAQSLKAAHQLSGHHGEKPLAGSTRIIDQGVNPTTTTFPFDSNASAFTYHEFAAAISKFRKSRKADAFDAVDAIRFQFKPGGLVLKDCIVLSIEVDAAGTTKNEVVHKLPYTNNNNNTGGSAAAKK